MSHSNNVDNCRKARQVFITCHQPFLKDILSSHEISQLIKKDHYKLQEIGKKMHHVFNTKLSNDSTTSASYNTTISSLYQKQIDEFLLNNDDCVSLYLTTIYNQSTLPSTNDQCSTSKISSIKTTTSQSSTHKKGFLKSLLGDKPIPRKKKDNTSLPNESTIDKKSSRKGNDNTKSSSNYKNSTHNNNYYNNGDNNYYHRNNQNLHSRDDRNHHRNSHYQHGNNRNLDGQQNMQYFNGNNTNMGPCNSNHQMHPYHAPPYHMYSFNPHSYNPHNYDSRIGMYGYVPNHYVNDRSTPVHHGHHHYPLNQNHISACDDKHQEGTQLNKVDDASTNNLTDKVKDSSSKTKNKTPNKVPETKKESNSPSSVITDKVAKPIVLSKPIVYEKKESLNKSITKKSSNKLHQSLIKDKTITTCFLGTLVTLVDTSSSTTTPEGKTDPEHVNGSIIRCYKIDGRIFWKIELNTSKYFIVVETDLCSHIIKCTDRREFYKIKLYKRDDGNSQKPHKTLRKNNKRKAIKINDYFDVTNVDLCVFCGLNSKKTRKKVAKYPTTETNNQINHCCNVLTCSVCSSISCHDCLQSLLIKLDNKNEEKDKWHQQVVNFLCNGETPKDFVGHCCELQLKIEASSDNLKEVESTIKDMKYDGCLHFPELHILLDTPYISHVDIHGLGKEQPLLGTPGLLHGVVNKECAIECHQQKLVPNGTSTNLLSERQEIIEFNNIHQENKSLVCCIQIFEMDNTVQDSQLKHYHPTPELISSSKHMQLDMTNIDVWIILAKPSSNHDHCHLVNMRWKSNLDYKKWSNDLNSKHLFHTIKSRCKNNGYEAKRTGGSNGFTSYSNRDIVNLLATNAAFPRKGKGVKVVKKDKKWICYYHGVRKNKDGKTSLPNFVSWSYTQPKIGGNFEMKGEIVDEFQDIIFAMTEIKYNSACLIDKLNTILNTTIQQLAVESAIDDMNVVRKKIMENSSNVTSTMSKDLFLRELALKNKFTLVAYPCGYHHDVFDKRSFSLENKICFGYENSNDTSNSIGRGGQGINMFVFALLDWTNTSK